MSICLVKQSSACSWKTRTTENTDQLMSPIVLVNNPISLSKPSMSGIRIFKVGSGIDAENLAIGMIGKFFFQIIPNITKLEIPLTPAQHCPILSGWVDRIHKSYTFLINYNKWSLCLYWNISPSWCFWWLEVDFVQGNQESHWLCRIHSDCKLSTTRMRPWASLGASEEWRKTGTHHDSI